MRRSYRLDARTEPFPQCMCLQLFTAVKREALTKRQFQHAQKISEMIFQTLEGYIIPLFSIDSN